MQNSNLKILCIVFTWFGKIHDIQVPLFSFNRSVENWTSNLQFEHGQLTEMTGARDYRLINRWVALHLRKHTPWKINGWNLQPSPMKRKEHDLPNPYDYVPALNLPGCNGWNLKSSPGNENSQNHHLQCHFSIFWGIFQPFSFREQHTDL